MTEETTENSKTAEQGYHPPAFAMRLMGIALAALATISFSSGITSILDNSRQREAVRQILYTRSIKPDTFYPAMRGAQQVSDIEKEVDYAVKIDNSDAQFAFTGASVALAYLCLRKRKGE